MPDFIQARFAACYHGLPDARGAACCCRLVRPLWLLTAAPERSWEHQTAQFNLIGREYGEDEPTGNARLTLTFETTRRAPSVAQLERELRCHELAPGMLPSAGGNSDFQPEGDYLVFNNDLASQNKTGSITIGMDAAIKGNEELATALAAIRAKGWTVTEQYNS